MYLSLSITVYLSPCIYLHISFFIYVHLYISTFVCQPLFVFVNFRICVPFYISPLIYLSPSSPYSSLFVPLILNRVVLYLCIHLYVFTSVCQPLYIGVPVTVTYLFNKNMKCRGLASRRYLFFYSKYEVRCALVYPSPYISHSSVCTPLPYVYSTPPCIPNSSICTLLLRL